MLAGSMAGLVDDLDYGTWEDFSVVEAVVFQTATLDQYLHLLRQKLLVPLF